jgi:ribosomal protein S18 acetylase RimI-like enzyme
MNHQDIILRNASKFDVEQIAEINNSFLTFSKSNGFIISKIECNQLEQYILSNPNSIKVAINQNNELIGFIEVSSSVDVNVISKLQWFDQNTKSVFENGEKLYIEKVAVKPTYQRQNVGKFIYEAIFEEYPEHIFYSFIVKKPFDNIVSVKFHKEMGFIETAKFKADQFLGLKGYESVMLMKF